MKRRCFPKITLPLAVAGEASFAPAAGPDLTFGLIADPQCADAEPIATLGDLIDLDFATFRPVTEIYTKLAAPHHPILGDHDFYVADADKGKVLAADGMESVHKRGQGRQS